MLLVALRHMTTPDRWVYPAIRDNPRDRCHGPGVRTPAVGADDMLETTDLTTETAAPGWCDWHKGQSGTARLIDIIEKSSGPGVSRFACAPCREQRGLVALAERPDSVTRAAYTKHSEVCGDCGLLVHGVVRRCDWGAQLWNAYQTALHNAVVSR